MRQLRHPSQWFSSKMLQTRCLSTTPILRARTDARLSLRSLPLKIALVGAGPAGFYAAARLLGIQAGENLRVDMFEELPVPFGLVRFGVAPDHPEVKNCQHKFEETASDPRFRFFGNVQIGGPLKQKEKQHETFVPPSEDRQQMPLSASIPISTLKDHYNAVFFTYGASHDRLLDVPGENLANVHSARSFVHLYNGHPYNHLLQKLNLRKIEHVTIIGQGNVALDCARMLLTPVDELRHTDTPEIALAELARSNVKHVSIVGRRGPLQFQGTTKELREMMQITDSHFQADSSVIDIAASVLGSYPDAKNARMKTRLLKLMKEGSKAGRDARKSWSLEYLHSPKAFLPSPLSINNPSEPSEVRSVDWEVNELVGQPNEDPTKWVARGTGKTVSSQTHLVLKSVGYRSIGIPGLPFDKKLGIVLNSNGRIDEQDIKIAGKDHPRLYTSGWLARGPNGVLTTTMMDAFMTAEIAAQDLSEDVATEKPLFDPARLADTAKIIEWKDWQLIDAEERKRGSVLGKPREKFLSIQEMVDVVH